MICYKYIPWSGSTESVTSIRRCNLEGKVVTRISDGVAFLLSVLTSGISQVALAADDAQMMSVCNTYAAHQLRVSTSDISTLSYEGQRTDGTHAVNWVHSAPKGCPADVSEADRYRYSDCG